MLTSYKSLAANEGELKWVTALEATPDKGVSQTDLDAAELWARDTINLWIIKVAGEKRGGEIVAEFMGAADETEIDPAVRHLAELLAAAKLLRTVEQFEFYKQGAQGGEQLKRRDWNEILADAQMLGKKIEKTKKSVKADATIRRWGLGRGQQGPLVNGPMTSGSQFDDRGIYVDATGAMFTLPHVSPIRQATQG